jgi:hypothetical protein
MSSHRQRPWIVALLLLFSLLLTLLPGVAVVAAQTDPPLSQRGAVLALQAYEIVDRRPESQMRLGDPITRAEMAKVLGAALGEGALAERSLTPAAFPDTEGHWANGWITVARSRGLFLGRPDGLFYPEAPVTHAEALTALLRLTGRSQEAGRDWPWGAIITALNVGLLPRDVSLEGRFNEPATRGDLFRYTAIAVGRVPLADTGKTLLQTLRDQTPPLLALTGFPKTTSQRSIVVRGESGDAVSVSVMGKAVDVLGDGTFSVAVDLEPGENLLPVVAMDGAGNRAEATAAIHYEQLVRLEFAASVIEAAVGHSFLPEVLRVNASGRSIPAENPSWAYDTGALSRDEATGRFSPKQPGEFTLRAMLEGKEAVARVVVAGEPAALELSIDHATLAAGGAPTAVRIRVVDQFGRLNPAGTHNVQVSTVPTNVATLDMPSVATREGKAVVYLAPGINPGGFGLQAKVMGAKPIESALMPVSVEVRRLSGIKLQTVPANFEPARGLTISITAIAVDQMGAPMTLNEDLSVTLQSSNQDVLSLSPATAIIRAGSSTSEFGGQNAMGKSNGGAGTAMVQGVARSLQVEPATVSAASAGRVARLEVDVLQEVALADDLSATIVAVIKRDAAGVVVAGDRTPVVLIPRAGNVSITPLSDAGGVTTFALRSSTAGRVTVTAGLPGRPELNSATAGLAFVQAAGRGGRATLKFGAASVRAGEAVSVHAALVGNSGAPLPNPGPPLIFTVQSGAGGALSGTELVIPPGATHSEDLSLNVAQSARSVSLSASLGGRPVAPAFISILPPLVGPVQPVTGLQLVAIGPGAERSPAAGEESRFVVQARSGGQLQRGSYAFKLQVKLDGQVLTQLPPNLKVTMGKRSVMDSVLRTTVGEAEIWVDYTGIGVVELVPVKQPITYLAYDQWGVQGQANSTDTFPTMTPGRVTYVPGPLHRLDVSVDPGLGGSLQAIIRASRGRQAQVRLAPVDPYGNPAGTSCVASLTRLTGLPADSLVIRAGSADVAEHSLSVDSSGAAIFTIVALTDRVAWSEWAPRVVCGTRTLTIAENVRISTTLNLAQTPEFEFAGGDVSGEGSVKRNDDYLRIRIKQGASDLQAAEVLVYDGDTLLGRYGPVNPGQSDQASRTINIPKADLGTNSRSFGLRLRLNSGADVSEMSDFRWVYYTTFE